MKGLLRALFAVAGCAAPVAAAIDALYPQDEAHGYRAGELRGAFTITWP